MNEFVNVKLVDYYAKPELYGYIPAPVFDALEAAYLRGDDVALVPRPLYAAMLANINAAKLCPK